MESWIMLKRANSVNSVDLHVDLEEREYPLLLPVDDLWACSSLIETGGLRFRLLSPTHQIMYHIMHTEIHHRSYDQGIIDLRQLYDFSLKIGKFQEKVEWKSVEEIFFRFRLGGVYQSYLNFSKRLMNSVIPLYNNKSLSTSLHFRRVLFYVNWPKTSALIRLIFGFFNNLSREMICEEYNCGDNFVEVSYWRLRRLFQLMVQFSKLDEIKKLWSYHTRF